MPTDKEFFVMDEKALTKWVAELITHKAWFQDSMIPDVFGNESHEVMQAIMEYDLKEFKNLLRPIKAYYERTIASLRKNQ